MPSERPLLLSPAPIEGTETDEARDRPPGSHFLQLFFFFSVSLVEIKAHILQPKRLPAERALSEALSSSTPRIPSPSCSAGGFPAGRGGPGGIPLTLREGDEGQGEGEQGEGAELHAGRYAARPGGGRALSESPPPLPL